MAMDIALDKAVLLALFLETILYGTSLGDAIILLLTASRSCFHDIVHGHDRRPVDTQETEQVAAPRSGVCRGIHACQCNCRKLDSSSMARASS
jgi:hypothetical protein